VPDLILSWLGQAGLLIDVAGVRMLVDPFLSEHPDRLHPPPDTALVASDIDWVLVTHGHGDHFDPESIRAIAALSPDAALVVPSALTQQASELHTSLRVVPVRSGETLEISADLRLQVTPAFHANRPEDGYSDGRDGGDDQFVGYILATPALTIYHAGDTLATDGLLAAIRGTHIDVALLPINGRDADREAAGIAGNMDAREAVEFAEAINAATLIPLHWDLIKGNTAAPGLAADAAAPLGLLHVQVLARYRPVAISAAPGGVGKR
jgi:L-ascorbate 6-phosphate lactonase